jgi:hypothetical protein
MVAAGCFLLARTSAAGEKAETKVEPKKVEKTPHDPHGGHFEACALACTKCLLECESCMLHCVQLLAQGRKDHQRTVGTCLDCAAICGAAARVAAHHGPLANPICEACAKVCDACGAACQKFTDDEHMQRCAKACRECAQACREMIRQVGHPPALKDKEKEKE